MVAAASPTAAAGSPTSATAGPTFRSDLLVWCTDPSETLARSG